MGAEAALAADRLLASQLVGVGAWDPMTFAAVAPVLTAVALLATAVPALRVDPVVMLRAD